MSIRSIKYFIGGIRKLDGDRKQLLQQHFEQHGEVEDIFLFEEKGFGFVTIKSEQKLDEIQHEVNGMQINVQRSKAKGAMEHRFFVFNLNELLAVKTSDEIQKKLEDYFDQFGLVKEAFLMKGKNFGFVSCECNNQDVLSQEHMIDGIEFKVKMAKPKIDGSYGGAFAPDGRGRERDYYGGPPQGFGGPPGGFYGAPRGRGFGRPGRGRGGWGQQSQGRRPDYPPRYNDKAADPYSAPAYGGPSYSPY